MRSILWILLAGSLVVGGVGCEQKKEAESKGEAPKEAAREHASTGPHQGDLIELGNEEYHGEFVHDEKTEDVTIYILDSSAKNAVPIEMEEVIINLKHDGKPEQHKLVAAPMEGEEKGKSSRFVAKGNHDLSHAIEEMDADARLQVTIAGKSYSGKIEHSHDHADHDHDHDHEKK